MRTGPGARRFEIKEFTFQISNLKWRGLWIVAELCIAAVWVAAQPVGGPLLTGNDGSPNAGTHSGRSRQERPTSADVAKMREELRARQAERAERAGQESLVPWRQLAESPDQAAGNETALVRLVNDTGIYRAYWIFTPGAGNTAAALRVPLCWRGEQWLALPPGEWRATVALGRPDGARAFRFAVAEARLRRGEVFELAVGAELERVVQARERDALEALKEQAAGAPRAKPE